MYPKPFITSHTILTFDDGTKLEFESYVPEIKFEVGNDVTLSHKLIMMVNPSAEFKVTLTDEGKRFLVNKVITMYNRNRLTQFWIDIKQAWKRLLQ